MILSASTTERGRALWRSQRDRPQVLSELERLFERSHGGKPDEIFGDFAEVEDA